MLTWLAALDGAVLLWIQDWVRNPILNAFFSAFTHLGDAGMLWIALALVFVCIPRTRKAGICALTALLLGLLCTNVTLKHLVERTRPWLVVEGLIPLIAEGDPNSFPSGHTTAAFAAVVVWWKTLPWTWGRVGALALAVLMGCSRLYVGVHFPSDVLAGAAVGALCALAALALWRGIAERRSRRSV